MKFARQRYQQGSLGRVERKSGIDVWEYRFRNHAEAGSPLRQITLSTLEYPTEAKARIALQERVLDLNGAQAFKAKHNPTIGLVIDRFIKEEKLEEILGQPTGEVVLKDGLAYSTVRSYMSYLNGWIRPRWGKVSMSELRPSEVEQWLKALALAAKTRGHVKALMHLLFERAMLWDLLDVQRNPIELIKLKGISKRRKRPLILTPDQFLGFGRDAFRLAQNNGDGRDVYRLKGVGNSCTPMGAYQFHPWDDADSARRRAWPNRTFED